MVIENKLRTFPQMAVFDIDGTITSPHSTVLTKEIIDGFIHLQAKGVITTISTGRPYYGLKRFWGMILSVLSATTRYFLWNTAQK